MGLLSLEISKEAMVVIFNHRDFNLFHYLSRRLSDKSQVVLAYDDRSPSGKKVKFFTSKKRRQILFFDKQVAQQQIKEKEE